MTTTNNLPISTKSVDEFVKKFIESQQPLEPEFEKVFWDNYWELLG